MNSTLHPARSRAPLAPSCAGLSHFFPLNFQLSTVNSPASPLFVALPYVSSPSPLSTAFTHFDRGGRVHLILKPTHRLPVPYQGIDSQVTLSHRLTNPYSNNSFLFRTICVARGGSALLPFRVTSHESPITSHAFSATCALFVTAFRPLSFIFNGLWTLFANTGGGGLLRAPALAAPILVSARLGGLCASALSLSAPSSFNSQLRTASDVHSCPT